MKYHISIENYNHILESIKNNTYVNYISYDKCRLGESKTFKVKNTELTITMRCCQVGGMFTGSHCFVPLKNK